MLGFICVWNNASLTQISEGDLPGNTLSGRFFSKLRTKALAVMLKICLGVKLTPSLTWKLNPPDMAPGNAVKQTKTKIKSPICQEAFEAELLDSVCCSNRTTKQHSSVSTCFHFVLGWKKLQMS